MKLRIYVAGALCTAIFSLAGCRNPPGKPGYTSETKRPDQVLDFPTLYANNCAACHGDQGWRGAAISLANPVYLSVAGLRNIEQVTANGVPGTMMPPFARSAGGLLTDEQIEIVSEGIIDTWGKHPTHDDEGVSPYTASTAGNVSRGQADYAAHCAKCHGANSKQHTGSLVDPDYLALISDQGLRSIIIAGQPEQGMPSWLAYAPSALTNNEITDIVAWLASNRTSTPGKPYRQRQ